MLHSCCNLSALSVCSECKGQVCWALPMLSISLAVLQSETHVLGSICASLQYPNIMRMVHGCHQGVEGGRSKRCMHCGELRKVAAEVLAS